MSNDLQDKLKEADSTTMANIHGWIKTKLSANHEQFNNLSACPYAKEALIKNEVIILTTSSHIAQSIQSVLQSFDTYNKRVIVLSCPKDSLTVQETESLVKEYRSVFAPKNLWLMYDHPLVEESVENIDFSYGKSLLFFFQRLDDISESAKKLLDMGYYKHWPKDYFAEVYFERNLLNLKNKS